MMNATQNTILILLCFALTIGSAVPASAFLDITGKNKKQLHELQREYTELETKHGRATDRLTKSEAENKKLQKKVATLTETQSTLEGEVAKLTAALSESKARGASIQGSIDECRNQLAIESKRGTGIKIIFFGGDIIYEIAPEAFTDYRAGLRYRSLRDPEFTNKLKTFEQGAGGDLEVLAVLKEVDISRDRYINSKEARSFRKSEETL